MNEEKLICILKSLPLFAQNFLVIHDKSGATLPLKLNRAQQYIHERLEAQREATGKVRALILKGRQQGCSTYVQARFFHKIVTKRGKKAFILTHLSDATRAIFVFVESRLIIFPTTTNLPYVDGLVVPIPMLPAVSKRIRSVPFV